MDNTSIGQFLGTRFKQLQEKLEKPLVFFDLETTGVNPKLDRIVEITMIKITKNKIHDPVVIRMNPSIPIPSGASNVHGIFDDDVAELPGFKAVGKKIADIMEGSDYAGYNAKKYDVPLLQAEFARYKFDIDMTKGDVVDPFVIFKSKMRHNLTSAMEYYAGRELNNAHNSLADTLAALEVLSEQLERYDDLPITVSGLSVGNIGKSRGPKKPKEHFIIREGKAYCNFGKHEGKHISELPTGYLGWMLNEKDDPFPEMTHKIIQEYLDKKTNKLQLVPKEA
jgi:DNA polymerase-3 subunit epsilon